MNKNEKIAITTIFLSGILAVGLIGIFAFNLVSGWYRANTVFVQSPITFEFRKMVVIEKVKAPETVIKKEVIYGDEVDEIDTPIEEMILARWKQDYPMAKAVFQAESGLKCDAYNVNTNGTIDVGVAQVNSSNWDLEEGFGLAEAVDCEKNLDMAYRLWDRGDGLENDGSGNFSAWVAYSNKSWIAHLE